MLSSHGFKALSENLKSYLFTKIFPRLLHSRGAHREQTSSLTNWQLLKCFNVLKTKEKVSSKERTFIASFSFCKPLNQDEYLPSGCILATEAVSTSLLVLNVLRISLSTQQCIFSCALALVPCHRKTCKNIKLNKATTSCSLSSTFQKG